MKKLTQEQKQLLYSIADRYCTSIPVSGNWRTETEHELNAICKELGVRKDTAKNIMKKYLGFTDREFIKAGLNSDKNSADKIYKVVSEIADRHGSAGEALNYVNDNAPSNLKKYINDRSKYIDDEDDAFEILSIVASYLDRFYVNESKIRESNPITVDLPEDLDDFLQDIVQGYSHSLSYGDLIRHKYTKEDITDLYEIMATCEKKDYDADFIENVAVPAIERIFFGPEPNPEDYEPTYEGYLKYCRDTNGDPRSKEEWTKITGLTEAYEDNDDRENFPYFVTVKDLTEDCSEIDSFFDILPDLLQDELVFPGQVIYEYKDPRTARIFFKDKQAAINFASNIDRSHFEVRFYTRINKVQERKLKESNLITADFACGPGFITEEHTNDYDSYESEETIYDAGTASSIEDMAQSKDWSENLAEYYDGDGVDSIYFKEMMEINHGYYMVWQVTYDPELASEEQIKDYLTGQMSDGWGEGFEQHSFGNDIDDEEVELEDEDDEGNTFYYNDTVNTRIEYFYSPWNGRNFEVINLNEEV